MEKNLDLYLAKTTFLQRFFCYSVVKLMLFCWCCVYFLMCSFWMCMVDRYFLKIRMLLCKFNDLEFLPVLFLPVYQFRITKYLCSYLTVNNNFWGLIFLVSYFNCYYQTFVNYFSTSGPKYKIQNTFNESNWNTKYIQESLRVNQSTNQWIFI